MSTVLDAAVPEVVRDAVAFTDMGLRTRLLDGGPPLVPRVATLGLRDVFATADPPPAADPPPRFSRSPCTCTAGSR